MIMKLKFLVGIILLSLCSVSFISCDDDSDPISLFYGNNDNPIIDNKVSLIYPTANTTKLLIKGGDNNYTCTVSDETKIRVRQEDNALEISPLGIGEVVITIKDADGNSYILNVTIAYLEQKFSVIKHDVTVIGEELIEDEIKAIKEQALATIPVSVDGGYRFVYTDNEESKGIVYLYPKVYGGEYKEGVFERYRKAIGNNNESLTIYKISIDGETREYIFMPYQNSNLRSDMIMPLQFAEDLLELFIDKYPVVQVYTSQVLTPLSK